MGKKRGKKRQLEMAIARVHLRFGPRSLIKGRTPTALDPSASVPHIPTGFSPLDRALGIGGLPKGRVTELVGLPTSGKTTLALKFLSLAQADGGQVAPPYFPFASQSAASFCSSAHVVIEYGQSSGKK